MFQGFGALCVLKDSASIPSTHVNALGIHSNSQEGLSKHAQSPFSSALLSGDTGTS